MHFDAVQKAEQRILKMQSAHLPDMCSSKACFTEQVAGMYIHCARSEAHYLDARTQQSLGKLCGIVQGGACVSGAVQQQHRWHKMGIARSMHHIGGGQGLQLGLALEAHDAVKQGVIQPPLVEVLPQICTVVYARDADQTLDLGGVPLGGATKDMLPASSDFSLYVEKAHDGILLNSCDMHYNDAEPHAEHRYVCCLSIWF